MTISDTDTFGWNNTPLWLQQCAEIAGYLWQKGWAERNGGNVVVRIPEDDVEWVHTQHLTASYPQPIGMELPLLRGGFFYSKGSGCRMRDVARAPLQYGCVVEVLPDAQHYIIHSHSGVVPTSELTSHLLLHQQFAHRGVDYRATLHTHPITLVAMTHVGRLCPAGAEQESSQRLNRLLWSMLPEAKLFVPKGLALVPYLEPGSMELAHATCQALQHCDVALWSQHGAMAVGKDVVEAFDAIDILEKAAQIYLQAHQLSTPNKG